MGIYLIAPIWAACKAIFEHFTRYASTATEEQPHKHQGKGIYVQIQPHRDAHEGRQIRRKGQKKRTEEGKNEGMKYYNKRSRVKLS